MKIICRDVKFSCFSWFHLWTDYTGQGVDQLQKVIDTIKTNPEDRRIIMCAWNPKGEANGDLLL